MFSNKIILALCSVILSLSSLTYAATSGDSSIEEQILVHINQYRQQHGLSKLTMNHAMVVQARQHSMDMATHRMPFGHNQFGTRIKRLHAQVKDSGAGAENVAYNYRDAQDVVKNWLRSPGHKRNIDGHYNLTGIGVARDGRGKLYFTQIFLRTGASPRYAVRRTHPNPFNRFFYR